jgi:hypothetical protein
MMEKAQALQIVQALAEEVNVGVADGESVSHYPNAHFIRACQVARPNLEHPSTMRGWSLNPNLATVGIRNQWAEFFGDLALALLEPVTIQEKP